MSKQPYLRLFLIVFVTLTAAITGINYLVDPYSIFASQKIDGFSRNKVDFVEHLRLTNIYAVHRVKPDALIIGTSRTGRGLSPDHPAFKDLNCYNLALAGINLYEMLRYIQHAQAIQPLKTLVIGIDFRSFHQKENFSEDRFSVTPEGSPNFNLFSSTIPDMTSALLSMDATIDSLRTVRFQSWQSMELTDKGQWLTLRDNFDHAKAFKAITSNTFKRYKEYSSQNFDMDKAIEPFKKIVEFSHANNINLKIYISPSHAWHWEALRMSGLQNRFEQIKEQMLRINAEEAARRHKTPFPLWDFSGYYFYTVEDFPEDSRRNMKWFWESVHFKPVLGDLILNRLFDVAPHSSYENPEFGVQLDTLNFEINKAKWRVQQQAYEATHQQDIHQIMEIYQDVAN